MELRAEQSLSIQAGTSYNIAYNARNVFQYSHLIGILPCKLVLKQFTVYKQDQTVSQSRSVYFDKYKSDKSLRCQQRPTLLPDCQILSFPLDNFTSVIISVKPRGETSRSSHHVGASNILIFDLPVTVH